MLCPRSTRSLSVLLPLCSLIILALACRSTPPPPKAALPGIVSPAQVGVSPALSPAPATTVTLRDYLKQQLGPQFHPREEWAGTDSRYAPRPYPPRVWAPIGNVYAVTIHHAEMRPSADTAGMIRSIFNDHTRPGGRLDAADVGYHFFIDYRGQVWEGRDAGHVGTHVGSRPPGLNNPGNLGICGLGAFIWEEPPEVMVQQAVNLSVLLARYYGHPLIVRGHRDWSRVNGEPDGATTCPGKFERAVVLASEKMLAAFPNGAAGDNRALAGPGAAPGRSAALGQSAPLGASPMGNQAGAASRAALGAVATMER